MPKHLTKNEKGRWKYQRAVPDALQKVVGKQAWVVYLGKTYSETDAERAARDLDIEADAMIARCRNMTPEERALAIKHGGLKNALSLDGADSALIFADIAQRDLDKTDPNDTDAYLTTVKALTGGRYTPSKEQIAALPGQRALSLYKAKKDFEALRVEVKERASMSGDTTLREDRGLGALLALSKSATPKSIKRTRLYLSRFLEHLGGDREPRTITQNDVGGWRDAMKDAGFTIANQAQILGKVSALFATAVSKTQLPFNPFAGVKPDGVKKKSSDKKRAFKPDELNKFFAAANKVEGSFPFIAECLLYTGARSSEICGLRVCDVRKEDGVLVFDINDEVRSLKNDATPRLVPVASTLTARILALTKDRNAGDWLFDDLPRTNADSAEHQYQNRASKIIRTGKIATRVVDSNEVDDKRVTAHALRHLWTQTAENLEIEPAVAYGVLGHEKGSDIHSKVYSDRPPLRKLKAGVEKVAKALEAILR